MMIELKDELSEGGKKCSCERTLMFKLIKEALIRLRQPSNGASQSSQQLPLTLVIVFSAAPIVAPGLTIEHCWSCIC